jgi:hypothetical protein
MKWNCSNFTSFAVLWRVMPIWRSATKRESLASDFDSTFSATRLAPIDCCFSYFATAPIDEPDYKEIIAETALGQCPLATSAKQPLIDVVSTCLRDSEKTCQRVT